MADEPKKTFKLGKRHLRVFQRGVLHYLKLFGITGWQLEFALANTEGAMATVVITERRVDVSLCPVWNEEPTPERLRAKAKHEVFHIFVGRYAALASSRYVSQTELTDAEEELVQSLLAITRAMEKLPTKK